LNQSKRILLVLVLVLILLLLRTLMSAYLSPPGMTRFIQSGFLLRSCANSSTCYFQVEFCCEHNEHNDQYSSALGMLDVSRLIVCCFVRVACTADTLLCHDAAAHHRNTLSYRDSNNVHGTHGAAASWLAGA
jgi:hypothetical protein